MPLTNDPLLSKSTDPIASDEGNTTGDTKEKTVKSTLQKALIIEYERIFDEKNKEKEKKF